MIGMIYMINDIYIIYMFALRFILSNDLPSLFFPRVKKENLAAL